MAGQAGIDALGREEIDRLLAGPERGALIARAAEEGLAEAQAILGQQLLDRNRAEEAFAWFSRAAQQGHVLAVNMVGRCYDLGWGVAVDKARAAECFRWAAEAGLDWGMYNYATALTLGAGVDEDKGAALGWLRKAAALGNAKAINFIGSFHEDGWVVERDMAEAARLYAQAAEGGDFRGAFNHARMLIDAGDMAGGSEWIAKALEWGNDRFRAQVKDWCTTRGLPC